MQYGTDLQFLNGATATLQNSTLQNNTRGVYIYNAQPSIVNNSILNVQQDGILCNAAAYSPLFNGNKITSTTANYSGINVHNNSTAYISHNDISGFFYGMYIAGGTTAYFMDKNYTQYYPNNRIRNTYQGIVAGWGGYVSLGYHGWYNSIYNNSYEDLYAYNQSSISAYYNYYGGGSPKTYADGTSYIGSYYNITSIYSDPWYGIAAPIIVNNDTEGMSSGGNHSLNKSVNIQSINNDGPDDEAEFEKGFEFERKSDYANAVAHYKNMYKTGKLPSRVLNALAHLGGEKNDQDIRNYFESLSNTSSSHQAQAMHLLAGLYAMQGQSQKSATLYDDIIKRFPKTHDERIAKFQKFYHTLHIENNVDVASKLLQEIKLLYANDDAENEIGRAESILAGCTSSSNSSPKGKATSTEIVTKYAASQNFPNPFNPTTTISYALPNEGMATLKVYDILGREVATLVNEYKTVGSYNVTFDATKLSSGIYIYKLQSGNFTSVKKMQLVK